MNPNIHARSFNFTQKVTYGITEWLYDKKPGRDAILSGLVYCKLAENYYFFDEIIQGAFE